MLDQKKTDKNALIGMLILGFLLLLMNLNTPSEEESKEVETPSTEQVNTPEKSRTAPVANLGDSTQLVLNQDKFGAFAQAALVQGISDAYSTLENDLIKVKIAHKGARVVDVVLKDYKKFDQSELSLIHEDSSKFDLSFYANNRQINTSDFNFVAKENGNSVSLFLNVNENSFIEYRYVLNSESYELKFSIHTVGMSDYLQAGSDMTLHWALDVPRQEKNEENERNLTTVYYKENGEVDNLSKVGDDSELIDKVEWVAFKDQFFSTILEPKSDFSKVEMATVSLGSSKNYVEKLSTKTSFEANGNASYDFSFYYVPNNFKSLRKFKNDFEYLIPLGWGIFGWINRFFVIELFHFLDGMDLNYGLIIFIVALVIKMLLYPFTKKSYKSMAAMRVLKPQLDEIKEKYPDDSAKQQQETMSLYSSAGVSPLSGCLPMLAQMPILFALFNFFPASIELRQQGFLWATDLSSYDSIFDLPFSIPMYGQHISLFALLMAMSSYLQILYNNQSSATTNQQMPQMKYMMYFMPVIFLGVMNSYAAALSYYYFIANMMTFAQQQWIRRSVKDEDLLAKIQARQSDPNKKNRLQRRLEDMTKMQEQTKKK
mgnify:CR=1 FL=1